MKEIEKMKLGQWYDANNDQELINQRLVAKDICYYYNLTLPSDIAKRNEWLTKLFGYLPNHLEIVQPFYCDYGSNIKIAEHVFINSNCYFMDGGLITIGKNVFIGPNCGLYTATHALEANKRNQGLEKALPITIEEDVWIGGNVVILPGVTIKKGSVIGALSIVNKDIEEHTIAVGNPIKIIRKIEQ